MDTKIEKKDQRQRTLGHTERHVQTPTISFSTMKQTVRRNAKKTNKNRICSVHERDIQLPNREYTEYIARMEKRLEKYKYSGKQNHSNNEKNGSKKNEGQN
ncbi:hypothetical protein JTB14_031539 [Gonioctena quinquepunctata]|nr:hypothetical protein JTB14_031539 [Gonioctena quinquepunctata]